MKRVRGLIIPAVLLAVAAPARTEPADVWLRNGLRLRGDVSVSPSEIVVGTALGTARFLPADVERIVPLGQSATAPALPAPAEPAAAPERGAATEPAAEPHAPRPPEPPLVSQRDIQLLRFQELRRDGPAESVRVQFAGGRERREFFREVLQELAQRPDYKPQWEDILLRGSAEEKLQLIVATTGTRYVDQIAILNDPDVFATFRSRVLPLVVSGCARSGCHGGDDAEVFRLSSRARSDEAAAYTAFVVLNALMTARGPLIDRDDPQNSALVSYMLPTKENPRPHPPVSGKRRLSAAIRSRELPAYDMLVDWIDSLRTPFEGYGLEYSFDPNQPADADAPAEPPDAAEPAAPEDEVAPESQPTTPP